MINLTWEREKTGHCWKGSSAETSWSCGNCDGARCESCTDVFLIKNEDSGEVVYTVEDGKIATQLINKENPFKVYTEIDFSYDTIYAADDKKLHDAMTYIFDEVIEAVDNKNRKMISYRIVSPSHEKDLINFINEQLEDSGIKSFKIDRLETNKSFIKELVNMVRINMYYHNAYNMKLTRNADKEFYTIPVGYVMVKKNKPSEMIKEADRKREGGNLHYSSEIHCSNIYNIDGTDVYYHNYNDEFYTSIGYSNMIKDVKNKWNI